MLEEGRETERVCRELLRWGKEMGGERCVRAPWEIQSASGTGRRTEAAREDEEGEVVAVVFVFEWAGWPVEEVRGGMALGDWRKALLFEEAL